MRTDRPLKNKSMVKLVYVYEGIEPEAPKSDRYRLIGAHYFGGIYEGKDNARLWDDVCEYIENTYDLEYVKKIYLNADGGGWISQGKERISGITGVLDEYHISRHLTSMTSHLKDSAWDAREMLREAIQNKTRVEFSDIVERIKEYAKDEGTIIRIDKSASYILSNWMASKIRLRKSAGVVGSSTEGHVSHVLASRMSSRPMGWSKCGADRMAKLRVYAWNGGDMLELVRYQNRELRQAAGCEGLSLDRVRASETKHMKDGRYYEAIQVSIPAQVRKTFAIRERLSGI